MKERILRLLNLKKSESAHVLDLLTVQFFTGVATALVTILAITKFIDSKSIDEIPQAYLVIAFALLVINVVYERLEHSLSAVKLLKIVLLFNTVVISLIWLGFFSGNEHTVVFILLVWTILIYMSSSYAFWGLASQLYNIRESKRIFTILGSADILSKLVGYAIAYPLMKIIDHHVLLVAMASLLTGAFLFTRLTKNKRWQRLEKPHHQPVQHDVVEINTSRDLIATVFKKELIFAISLLSLISYNVFNLVDYTFIKEIKSHHDDLKSLAKFVLFFLTFGRVTALILKLVFSSRVIERLGIITCLFITPLNLLFFSLMFLFVDEGRSGYTLYIFGIMTILTEVLRSTMQEPVFFILFQPLKEKFRLKGHLISKGYMLPPSLIIVGASLIIMKNLHVEISIMLIVKLLLINLLLWGVIIFFLRNAYLKTLRDSIKKGVFTADADAHIQDTGAIEILLEKISSGRPTEIIYALKLLEDADYPDLKKVMENLLTHSSMEVRYYVIDNMGSKPNPNLEILHTLLETEQNAAIVQKLFSVLTRKDPVFLKNAADNIHNYSYPLKKVVITSLLNQKEFDFLHHGGNDLNDLIHSPNPQERELAVQVIMELKSVRFTGAIELLIQDTDSVVKKNAIIAACRLKIKQLLPQIVEMLQEPASKYGALNGLLQYGDDLFHHIHHLPKNLQEAFTYDAIKLAGKVKGQHSTHYLLHKLREKTRYTENIIHSLWTKEFIAEDEHDSELLNQVLQEFLQAGKQKINDYVEVPTFRHGEEIREIIVSEIRNDLISSLKICSLLHNNDEFNRILELIQHGENSRLYNAVEMLDLVLPKKVSRDLNILFNYLFDPSLAKKTGNVSDISQFFNKIVIEEGNIFRPLTRAYCIYTSWKTGEKKFLHQLKKQNFKDEHDIIGETSQYVLKEMERDSHADYRKNITS